MVMFILRIMCIKENTVVNGWIRNNPETSPAMSAISKNYISQTVNKRVIIATWDVAIYHKKTRLLRYTRSDNPYRCKGDIYQLSIDIIN